MKRILVLLCVVALMVVMLAPMAHAIPPETTPPLDQNVSGKYSCLGPEQPNPGGGTFQEVFSPLSKEEAEEGLASGIYVRCDKNLPYQTFR